MDEFESLSHTKWTCKYHVVFIPKGRRKMLYGQLRHHLGEVFRTLAQQRESRIEEGHLMVDHVHMMIAIPQNTPCPRSSVTSRARAPSISRGFMASESAISSGSTSGPGATSSRRSVATKPSSEPTSRSRNRRISAWSN